ncbi:MAG: aldolase/citrate lyase family protein [Vicinamibacterales bacterium]
MTARRAGLLAGITLMAGLALWPKALGAGQGAAPAQAPAPAGQRRGGGAAAAPIARELTPMVPDSRGWGWQVKASVSTGTPRPFYNKAKELLFQDKQVTSYTISKYDPDQYCEVGKHFDFIWFEMQHSTMSWDEVAKMIATCPRVGAAPMIRMPDALEANMQKATDLGALGIIVPTVDDALEARDAARFARYPPTGRRSSGGGQYSQIWNAPGMNYRQTINDNMLVVVMIETLEGVANANEIASTFGVDVVIQGNNDLSAFSGWSQNDPRYLDALTKTHDAALRAGKFWGNAGSQYLTGGFQPTADTRFVQNGPARDGWTAPGGRGGRGRGVEEEPLIGVPGGAPARGTAPPAGAPAGGGRRGAGAQ